MKIQVYFVLSALSISFIFSACKKEEAISYNSHIRPILNKHCLSCHGGVRQQSELSFLTREEALQPAESGLYAIVPGQPEQSELLKRVKHKDPDYRMPPEGSGLEKTEIDLLRKWIAQGAKWEKHWAYVPPDTRLQAGQPDSDWERNGIDFFVAKNLAKLQLSPSPEADKASLARRVSLDLIGLPPPSDILEKFIRDNSEDAYPELVDQLLASPHFGERWASMWLDLARYADSKGYQKDLLRPNIWRYRDWVIDALNQDMPFDQFTIEQLAGDLLKNPQENQILATSFHRNTMTNDEGGTDDEEFRVAAVIDRVNTTFEVWQATTISCVQCHGHPYDPIKQEEFYKIYAYFNNSADRDLGSDQPRKTLLSPIQRKEKKQLAQQLNQFEQHNDTVSQAYKTTLSKWQSIQAASIPIMRDLSSDSSRTTHVFERGNWLVHGQVVQPDVPKSLNTVPDSFSKNRLGLAQWLVHKDNPLTARVMVNRFWEQLFGQGLVETLEDMGTQGIPPSNQELLDWLALEFMHNHKWSIKSLLKQIVLSATYRQDSKVNQTLLEKDPYNKYLARGPRIRLSAEQIRDQALAVSGLLNVEVGGPSVMPYQPEGVWNVIRHVGRWETSKEGNQHRRALYTFWRRVSPYPSMMAFDSPSRELCVSRRISTNTPLQALVTLNDPVYTEAAMALANRIQSEGGENLEDQLNYAYQLLMLHPPSKEKLTVLKSFYKKAIDNYKELADANFVDAETAAWFNVANVLLNLDEFIMKS
jgi:hypothetical protein